MTERRKSIPYQSGTVFGRMRMMEPEIPSIRYTTRDLAQCAEVEALRRRQEKAPDAEIKKMELIADHFRRLSKG